MPNNDEQEKKVILQELKLQKEVNFSLQQKYDNLLI